MRALIMILTIASVPLTMAFAATTKSNVSVRKKCENNGAQCSLLIKLEDQCKIIHGANSIVDNTQNKNEEQLLLAFNTDGKNQQLTYDLGTDDWVGLNEATRKIAEDSVENLFKCPAELQW